MSPTAATAPAGAVNTSALTALLTGVGRGRGQLTRRGVTPTGVQVNERAVDALEQSCRALYGRGLEQLLALTLHAVDAEEIRVV